MFTPLSTVFLVPTGWGELLTFIAQPIHLPIAMVACAMSFFVWRSLRAAS